MHRPYHSTSTRRLALATGCIVAAATSVSAAQVLTPVGSYATGTFDESAAEIPAYDPISQRLFVTNADADAIDVLAVSPTGGLSFIQQLTFAGSPNSVAVSNGVAVVALENASDETLPGTVAFFDPGTLAIGNTVGVGALPDMLTFSPDGSKVLVANEGQPNDAYTFDPEGSISIIDVTTQAVTTADFTSFNGQETTLRDSGVRIFGPGASAAQDFEPEYITISADGTTAYVSLQENNALATVDIATATVTDVTSFGFKDYAAPGNGIDPSNQDGNIDIRNVPVLGMYQPDAIASYSVAGSTFIVTANEGDARDYDGFSEEERVNGLTLDPTAYPDAATLQQNGNLGRLLSTTALGDTDNDGDIDQIYSYGGRSFSIFDDAGNLVFDSGDDFEQITAAFDPDNFNANNDDNTSFDSRSDDKGPEPEGVALGEIDGTHVRLHRPGAGGWRDGLRHHRSERTELRRLRQQPRLLAAGDDRRHEQSRGGRPRTRGPDLHLRRRQPDRQSSSGGDQRGKRLDDPLQRGHSGADDCRSSGHR